MTDIFCVNSASLGTQKEWILYIGTKNPSPKHALDTWDKESGGLAVVFYLTSVCLGAYAWTHQVLGAPWYREVNSYFLLQDNKKWAKIIDSFRNDQRRDLSIDSFRSYVAELGMEEIPFKAKRWEESSFAKGQYGEVTVCG